MSENHDEDKPQMNADKRRCGLDVFSFPGGEVLSADTLVKTSDLTPLHASFEINNKNNEHEKNNELKRTETNSDFVSSYVVRPSSLLNFSYQYAMTLGNSPGLTPLRFDCEIYHNNNEDDSVDKGFSAHGIDTLKNSSRLAPLRPFDKFSKRVI